MVGTQVDVSTRSDDSLRIARIFEANERRLGQFLVQMVRDRSLAEDLLQETFIDAFRARDRFSQVANPQAWLFGIARHRALAALRRHRRAQHALTRLRQRPQRPADAHALVEVMDVLDRVLRPDDRSLVLLRYVHDLDANALAELTGRSPAAIRKRLERACAALQREIQR